MNTNKNSSTTRIFPEPPWACNESIMPLKALTQRVKNLSIITLRRIKFFFSLLALCDVFRNGNLTFLYCKFLLIALPTRTQLSYFQPANSAHTNSSWHLLLMAKWIRKHNKRQQFEELTGHGANTFVALVENLFSILGSNKGIKMCEWA